MSRYDPRHKHTRVHLYDKATTKLQQQQQQQRRKTEEKKKFLPLVDVRFGEIKYHRKIHAYKLKWEQISERRLV